MPLSEHEERILAEIERQLAAEDPRFVARARRRRPLTRQTRVRGAIALGILGAFCVALLGFLPSPLNVVSAAFGLSLAFVAILLGISAATSPQPRQHAPVPPDERT
jgi:uncharacterized membrane protein YuzA (DUF378 family)